MAYHRIGGGRAPGGNREVERLRRALPLNQYLYMLHNGATTGYFPKLNPDGSPLPRDPEGLDDLTTSQRIDLTQYLTDKVMEDAGKQSDIPLIEAEAMTDDDLRQLPSEALRNILAPAAETADILAPAHVNQI